MKIIKEGDINRLKKVKLFECMACGCVFEADRTEYVHQYSQRENCDWYEIKCPTCGNFARFITNLISKEDANEP